MPSFQLNAMPDNYIFVLECLIKRYRQLVQQQLHTSKTGITFDQWIVLRQVEQQSASSQIEIAAATAKDAPTTTRIIEQLVNKQLVEKTLDKTDRRKFRVFVTSKGKQIIQQMSPKVENIAASGMTGLDNLSAENFIQYSQAILGALEKATI